MEKTTATAEPVRPITKRQPDTEVGAGRRSLINSVVIEYAPKATTIPAGTKTKGSSNVPWRIRK
jgi:hypothetical protein